MFTVHIYGSFQQSFAPNATLQAKVDCGSHCEMYGVPPGEDPSGEVINLDFCEMSAIEQPLGGKHPNVTCPPEKGYALIESIGYVMPLFLSTPVSNACRPVSARC